MGRGWGPQWPWNNFGCPLQWCCSLAEGSAPCSLGGGVGGTPAHRRASQVLCPGEITAMVSFKPLSVLRSGDSHLLPTFEGTKLREADQLHKGALPRSGTVRRVSGLLSVYMAPPGMWEGTRQSGQQCDSRPLPCPLQTHGRAVPVRMSSHRCQTKHLPQQANICVHPPCSPHGTVDSACLPHRQAL